MGIRIHELLRGSSANGPGTRNVVWFQGCTLSCPGCFNPLTHDPKGGKELSAEEVCRFLLDADHPCDGITISGGEPFQQPESLLELLQRLHASQTPPVLVFSGYPYAIILQTPAFSVSLPYIDALICGPYRADEPPAYERFCSSGNQELVIRTDRFKPEDFADLPLREWIIDNHGLTMTSGIFS